MPADELEAEPMVLLRYLRSGPVHRRLLYGLLGITFPAIHLPVLAEKATVYAVDMPGAGFSDRPTWRTAA
jgi:hypothetical protein